MGGGSLARQIKGACFVKLMTFAGKQNNPLTKCDVTRVEAMTVLCVWLENSPSQIVFSILILKPPWLPEAQCKPLNHLCALVYLSSSYNVLSAAMLPDHGLPELFIQNADWMTHIAPGNGLWHLWRASQHKIDFQVGVSSSKIEHEYSSFLECRGN